MEPKIITMIAVLVGLAIFFLPVVTLVRVIFDSNYGYWTQLRVKYEKRNKDECAIAKRKWANLDNRRFPKDKIRYFWFWKSIRIEGHRYCRFCLLVSLFWIWAYPIYVARHVIAWLWKQL